MLTKVLFGIEIVLGLIVIVSVLMQKSKADALSGLVQGSKGETFFTKNKSKTKEAMLGYFFSQDLSLQMMLEDIEYFYGMKMLHVHGITASLSSSLAMRTYLEDGKIETLFTSESRFRRGKYQFERLGLNNAQAYYGSLKLLKTYCEYKVYDLVFVTPPSSYLGQVRRRPDILVTIAESDIRAMVKREKEYLEEASKSVYLCYNREHL